MEKKIQKIIDLLKRNKEIIIIFILITILASTFLYIGDDWAWGSEIGLERLNTGFKDYNGRYLSNLLIIAITRVNILRILFTAIITTAILILIKKIADSNHTMYPFIFLLIIGMPINIFKNTIAWASGFVNYVLSIFMILMFLNLIKKIDQQPLVNKKIGVNLLYLLLGISTCLVVEHITIYCLFLILFLNIFHFIKYKKMSVPLICYSIGVIWGTIIMFSNGAYLNVVNGEDNYRTTNTSITIIKQVWDTYFDMMYKELIFNNYTLNITIVLSLIYLLRKERNNKTNILNAFNMLYVIYTVIKTINPTWEILGKYTKYVEGIGTIIFFLSLLYITIFNKSLNPKQKGRLTFLLISTVLIAAPLLVVTPVSSRCFFPCYILLVLYVVQILGYLKIKGNHYKKVIGSLIVVFYTFWLSVCSYNLLTNMRRTNYIQEQIKKGATQIEIYKLPYEEYIGCDWGSYPEKRGYWQTNFKRFYGIDENIQITMTDKSRKALEKGD